ncbi:ABC transporter substrate-binding protein [Pseudanabaena galeata]|uniref:ABC transporter substrate-binding protein n=1 Tax=Pseudanabaena galeata TaxID=1112103 RepID=UPI00247A4E15|nr:ABC transporter substrate-binding protein [Pseudanabaena galeata]MEA5486494.1 ABC transporter substrate-binding protein [Pseudanabaena sp. CCNP1317]WGS74179.1 ABC transporter substrate-binding protein [Pseudanabaena galeata CCNP1313]
MRRSIQKRTKVKQWKAIVLLLLIGMCSLLLWGCAVKPEALKNRLVVPLDSDIKTFNPVLINDAYSGIVIGYTLSGLISENPITKELEAELAEKWEFQQDGKQLIFTMRPDLKWSDGQPLTVDDVLFTYQNIIFNEKIPTGTRDVLRIGQSQTLPKVEKLDDRRISFLLSEPFAPALRTLGGIGVLPKHVFEPTLQEDPNAPEKKLKFLETWTLSTPVNQLVGSGAYMIQEYRPSERVIYKPNPYYWRKGKPYIEQFVMQIVESPDTALLRFRSQDLDMYRLRGEDYQLLKRFEQRDRYKIYNAGPATGQAFIMFNLNKGRNPKTNEPFVDLKKSKWFNDVNFRRAVAYALNREAMITNLSRGLAQTQNSPVSIPSPYFFPPEKGLKVYDYQPEKSKEILLQAGYKYNSEQQLLDAEGNLVRFTLLAPAGGRVAMGAQIKSDLEKIGMKIDFNPVDFRIISDKLDNSKQWDATILGFTGGAEPNSAINLWATDGDSHLFNKGPVGDEPPFPGREIADWEKKIHSLMIQGAQELDETKRKAIYAEYQQLVQEQLPLIHLTIPLYLVAVRDRVENAQPSSLAGSTGVTGALWNIEQLKLKS